MSSDSIYRPLRANEIRLLELRPATDPEAPLRCRIRHADLSTAEYAALSYVWGQARSDGPPIRIKYQRTIWQSIKARLSGDWGPTKSDFEIGNNLDRALRCLRRKHQSVVLWTDAICIDQDDSVKNVEKPRQVELMKRIYDRATVVQGWLGPSREEDPSNTKVVEAAFTVVDKVWALAQTIKSTNKPASEDDWLQLCFAIADTSSKQQESKETSRPWAEFAFALRKAVESDPSWLIGFKTLEVFSNLKWFSRVWILQEYGRAKSLIFHYGESQRPHLPVFLALSMANYLRNSQIVIGTSKMLQGFDKRFLACLTARTTRTQHRSFQDVLQAAYLSPPPRHNAGDPRDQIYGRLGLASDDAPDLGCIQVEYGQRRPTELYTSITRFLFEGGFMEPLVSFKPYDYMKGSPDVEGLPPKLAWVTRNWDIPSWAYEWSKDGLHTFGRYNASKSTNANVSFIQHSNAVFGEALSMKGVCVGVIQDHGWRFSKYVEEAELSKGAIVHGDLHTDIDPLSSDQKRRLETNIQMAHQDLNLTPSRAAVEELFGRHKLPLASFWRWWLFWVSDLQRLSLSIASQRATSGGQSENIAELLFREASARLQGDLAIFSDTFGTIGSLKTLLDLQRWSKLFFSGDARVQSVGSELMETFFRSAWGMRVATLDTGRLCYVPEDSGKGDRVVIFHGVKAPLVLRKEASDAYSILGPTHVGGVMRGELMETDLPNQTYVLV